MTTSSSRTYRIGNKSKLAVLIVGSLLYILSVAAAAAAEGEVGYSHVSLEFEAVLGANLDKILQQQQQRKTSRQNQRDLKVFNIIGPDDWATDEASTLVGDRNTTAAASGTNFPNEVPFNFTNIFFIGGICGEDGFLGGDDVNWYSQFVWAGYQTLNETLNVTDTEIRVICAEGEKATITVYSRDFHLKALRRVEKLAGDKLNETLVITAAVNMESDWTPVANLLRKGMAFFHAKEDPINFNLTEHGLSPEEVLYFYFRWDEEGSAHQTGVELCRLKKGTKLLKVAKIYMGGRNGTLNYRADAALESFAKACPETELDILWELDNDQVDAYKTTLRFNPLPDVVLTPRDEDADTFLRVAKAALPSDQYNRLSTMGWNNNAKFSHLVENRKILTTVDQIVQYKKQGLWFVIDNVLEVIRETGVNSTKGIQDMLNLGESLTITSDTLAISSDNSGYLTSNLLEGYDPDSPPYQNVTVSTGLYDVSLTEMIPFEGKFEAVLWLRASWIDPRLLWNPFVHNGKVLLDPDRIWTPNIYLKNAKSQEVLYQAQAMIDNTGKVMLETNIFAELLCDTVNDLASFPFDSYDCAIVLGAPYDVMLNQNYGFKVIASDPHFDTTTNYTMGQNHEFIDQNRDVSDVKEIEGGPDRVAYYEIIFVRKSFTAWVRLIIPAVLINMIGFISFWVDNVEESVALGVTSFLCALTFRETVDMPDTSDATFTEVFMMVNVCYQAAVLLIIFLSYNNRLCIRDAAAFFCQCLHPRQMARNMSHSVTQYRDKKKIELELFIASMNFDLKSEEGMSSRHVLPHNTLPPNSREERPQPGAKGSTTLPRRGAMYSSTKRSSTVGENREALPTDEPEHKLTLEPLLEHEYVLPESAPPSLTPEQVRQAVASDGAHAHLSMFEPEGEGGRPPNVDWFGRWFIVPSYFAVMISLVVNGWGYF